MLKETKERFRRELENKDSLSFDDLCFEEVVWHVNNEEIPVVVISGDGYDFEGNIMHPEALNTNLNVLVKEEADYLARCKERQEEEDESKSLFDF